MRRHWRRCVRWQVLILALAGILATSIPTQAAEVLDQSQADYVLGTGRAISATGKTAQTFEAGVSGDLTRVELALWYNNKPYPITVEIHQTSPDGALLASTEIPASSVTVLFGAGVAPDWVTATFSAPAAIEAGNSYAIVLRTSGLSIYFWAAAGYDAYASGTAWVCAGLPTCTWSAIPDNDTAFKTFVDVAIEYTVVPLYDIDHAKHAGSTVPVKIRVNDSSGSNVSDADLIVHAVSLTQDETTIEPVPAAGKSTTGGNFVFDPSLGDGGGYQFNVKTTGLAPGVWALNFTIGDESQLYSTTFMVR